MYERIYCVLTYRKSCENDCAHDNLRAVYARTHARLGRYFEDSEPAL